MGVEIERKFLVSGDDWKSVPGVPIRQGYLYRSSDCAVRVRIAGENAWLAVKGSGARDHPGLAPTHADFEYAVPLKDAEEMLKLIEGPLIEKTRHYLQYEGCTWVVDVFAGENAGSKLDKAKELNIEIADERYLENL